MSKIVLCIDDSATMQQVADITFRGTEFQYVGARSYDEAMDKARANKPAIVLADAAMPGKNGYDVCLALKSDAKLADVPVVILVGQQRAVRCGPRGEERLGWPAPQAVGHADDAREGHRVCRDGGERCREAGPGTRGCSGARGPEAGPAAPPSGGTSVPAPAAAAAAAAANQPPRSATIMGMPTIKMPAGVAPVATAPAPAKTPVMAVPPVTAKALRRLRRRRRACVAPAAMLAALDGRLSGSCRAGVEQRQW